MKAILLVIGKTTDSYLKKAVEEYRNRLTHYLPFEIEIIPELRNTKKLSFDQQKEMTCAKVLEYLQTSDTVVLLDEHGKEYSSMEFSKYMEQKMSSTPHQLIFIIGGPYGFSKDLYNRANGMISVSRMTFSHQMIRLIFIEQLYRALTIIKGEPYHHE